MRDLLHLSRTLRRSPASAAAAIVTISLTLGVGASIFAVVDAVLLTPPPFTDPDDLVIVGETPIAELSSAPRGVSYKIFDAWRERAGSLATLEAFDGTNLTLTGLGAAERVTVNDVTPGLLTLLGVVPALGRTFELNDIAQPVVIISHAFWRGKLGSDPRVIGRSLVLGSRSYEIVGVLPEQFVFEFNPAAAWRPLPLTPVQAARTGYRVSGIARLAGNISPELLGAALDDVSRNSTPPSRVVALPVATALAGDATRTLGVLAGGAGLALVIAFTNFAGLLIVRGIDRRREMAVRSALGARRFQIAGQLLMEAQALVAIGTLGGVSFALWMTPAVARLALQQFGGVAHRHVSVSWQLILAVAIAASICAAVCAVAPALIAARGDVLEVLHRGATPPLREFHVRRAFVIGEVAVAFVLLVSVTLLGRSLLRVLHANPGFDARGVLALQVSVPSASYPPERVLSFYAALQNALEVRLGPRTAAIVNEIPLSGSVARSLVSVRPGDVPREAVVREVGPAYFNVMRIPPAAGRTFEARDNASAPPRVVISESLAATLFRFQRPIGQQMFLAPQAQTAEVIGVVGNVKHRALDEAVVPTVYLSALQVPSRSRIVVVRSARSDADVLAAVREEVSRLDGNVPVYGVRSMQDVVAGSPGVPARRVLTATFMGFAVLALVLGATGLFGVVTHHVASRRAELALRIALGAAPMRILSATLGQGVLMVAAGLAAGAVLSLWATRALGSVVVTDRLDVLAVGLPAALLTAIGIGAVLPPAWRAARTDVQILLRSE